MEGFITITIATILWASALLALLFSGFFLFMDSEEDEAIKNLAQRADIEQLIEKIIMRDFYDDHVVAENRVLFSDTMQELDRLLPDGKDIKVNV